MSAELVHCLIADGLLLWKWKHISIFRFSSSSYSQM